MPRKPPAQLAETRTTILRAAAECFARDGFERATLQQIASASGFTVPTLYSHFESKQGLRDTLVQSLLEETRTLFDVLLPRGLTFPQKLELLIAHQLRWVEKRHHAFAFLIRHRPPIPHAAESTRHQHRERTLAWLTEHAGPDDLSVPLDVAAHVVDAISAAYFHRWIHEGAAEGVLQRTAPQIADVVLNGVGASST